MLGAENSELDDTQPETAGRRGGALLSDPRAPVSGWPGPGCVEPDRGAGLSPGLPGRAPYGGRRRPDHQGGYNQLVLVQTHSRWNDGF